MIAYLCVGGGSNAIGIFAPFLDDASVALFGVEAAGHGVETDKHAATLTKGRIGVLHGSKSYVLCDDDGQIIEPHSISAGLDYPGVGPQHSQLHESGRAKYLSATDEEALRAVRDVAREEGILIALETAHAFAALPRVVDALGRSDLAIVVCVSGRGDKDLGTLLDRLELSS
jgi:tryptophan synthase beta chain